MCIPRFADVLRPCFIALAAAALSGCGATEVARRPPTTFPSGGEQGGSWEAVFPTPSVALAAGEPENAPEFARSNDAVSHRPAEPLLASREWPEPDRPTLWSPRRIHLPDDPGTVLWLRRVGDTRFRFDRWHGSYRRTW